MHILVVDDHRLFREGLLTVLNRMENIGQISEAANGSQALCIVENEEIDLALIDFHLPDTTGAILLNKIKTLSPEIPVIIMSGAENPSMIKSAMSGGSSGFLPKSMEPDELVDAINVVLSGEIYVPLSILKNININQLDVTSGQGIDYADLIYMAKVTQQVISTSDWSIRAKHNSSKSPEVIAGFNQLLSKMETHYNELREQAFHDVLTDLPNRRLFNDRLDQALSYACRNKDKIALLTLDVDKFKQVNDQFGHDVGDALLKAIAKRLKLSTREIDTVSRFGGDEFSIVLAEIKEVSDVEIVLKRMLTTIREPLCLSNETLLPRISVGIVLSDGSDNATELIKQADNALYHVKRNGGNNFKIVENES